MRCRYALGYLKCSQLNDGGGVILIDAVTVNISGSLVKWTLIPWQSLFASAFRSQG